jgi:hypothetical protein
MKPNATGFDNEPLTFYLDLFCLKGTKLSSLMSESCRVINS